MNEVTVGARRKVQINKNRIRAYFYIGTVVPVFLFMLVFTLTISGRIKKDHNAYIEQLSNRILAEKKQFIKSTIDHTLYIIDSLQHDISHSQDSKTLTEIEKQTLLESNFRNYLHGLTLPDDEQYVWVNKIINEQGGDDFAIRLIHPGMPETEGALLSTNAEDIKGGKPYQVELDGVLANGEIFYSYYFKKKTSGKVERKLSYAKLIKPFNWVIATGIYLDDFEQYVDQERANLNESFDAQRFYSILLITFTMLCTAILIYLFERNINRLIFSYESEIKGYTEELEKLSTTDRLTNLHNRLFLDEAIEKELARFQRYGNLFSVVMTDIDHFKRVNDNFGHQQGDNVLQEFAQVLLNNTRESDVVGRWGGEEFIIICKECDINKALILANGIKEKVSGFKFTAVEQLEASFGVSSVREQDSLEQLIERADRALYKAKEEGRNKVVVEQSAD
ncbi:diguanylate cyclase [Reinekea marina]|uniref:diguanylate cyclase n=2 Tax=Reinekea marina TaxID=1310421 RepID=A0ABV7WRB9_9GAMM